MDIDIGRVKYYLRIAQEVSTNSKCLSRKVGAILVNPKTDSIIGTGYNGCSRKVSHCNEYGRIETLEPLIGREKAGKIVTLSMVDDTCPRRHMGYSSGMGLELCIAAHAERNAILNAARNGHPTDGSFLFCACGVPCKDCAIELINAGIVVVYHIKKDRDYDPIARILFKQAGVELRGIKI